MITLNFQKRLLQFEIKNELLENKVERLEERLESLRVPQSDSVGMFYRTGAEPVAV